MTISSMTGYATASDSDGQNTWTWEARSVNGRGLDVRLRLPPGLEPLEPAARDLVSKRLTRGNVSLTLTYDRRAGNGTLRVNEAMLAAVIRAIETVRQATGAPPADPAAVLSIKGVLEADDTTLAADADGERAILATLAKVLDGLVAVRRGEGQRLADVLLRNIDDIAAQVDHVRASPSRTSAAIQARLAEQVAKLMGATDTLDADRLHQEAVIIAMRADVAEELDRLDVHIAAARELMASDGPAGRKLDFLAQEFNREANTLCSKANAVDISRAGLALKSLVDQLREQVQNIE